MPFLPGYGGLEEVRYYQSKMDPDTTLSSARFAVGIYAANAPSACLPFQVYPKLLLIATLIHVPFVLPLHNIRAQGCGRVCPS
jgi:hypothetical protein